MDALLPSPISRDSECIDALLWIGPSYRGIECRVEPTCAVPHHWDRCTCFVHEAEWRGISRRVPAFPHWAIPGRTRVFLAKGGRGSPRGCGRVFGYFVLARTEIMVGDRVPMPGSGAGQPSRKDRERVRRKRCWDDSEIVTHRLVGGRWIRTDEECPGFPDPECLDGETITVSCPEGQVITVARCVDGRWVPTGEVCPTPRGTTCERFKPPRNCPTQDPETEGLRTTPGAVYLVDLLEADATDEFCRRLQEEGIPDAYRNAGGGNPSGGKKEILRRAHDLYLDTASEARKQLLASLVLPEELEGVADFRGSLVLFRDPPLCAISPRSGFRGLGHIDGTLILEQIMAGEPRVLICHCKEPGGNSMTKEEIVAYLACQSQVSQTLAARFLQAVSDLAESELEERGVFRLWSLGTYRAAETRVRAAADNTVKAMRKGEVVGHLAELVGCTTSKAEKLLGKLTSLARDQIASGRDFRFPGLGTFHPDKVGVRFRETKKMRELTATFSLSSQL